MSKKTRVNRKSKFPNKAARKAWRKYWAARPYTSAIRAYLRYKNLEAMGKLPTEEVE